jgi:hypothetical protein
MHTVAFSAIVGALCQKMTVEKVSSGRSVTLNAREPSSGLFLQLSCQMPHESFNRVP